MVRSQVRTRDNGGGPGRGWQDKPNRLSGPEQRLCQGFRTGVESTGKALADDVAMGGAKPDGSRHGAAVVAGLEKFMEGVWQVARPGRWGLGDR